MQKKTVLRVVLLVLIILWMLVIFGFSNQDGDTSSNLSQKIARLIVKSEEQVQIVEPYVRKVAHLSEYAIGGMLFISLFLTYNLSDIKRIIFSLLIGIEYAIIDEVHQLFIAGRSGQIIDVLIDSIGVALGICAGMMIYIINSKILLKRKDGA